jgi:hypothetical protein
MMSVSVVKKKASFGYMAIAKVFALARLFFFYETEGMAGTPLAFFAAHNGGKSTDGGGNPE